MSQSYLYGKSNLPPYHDKKTGKKKQCVCYYADDCDLWRDAMHVCIPGRGAEGQPKILLVGEAPGNQEDKQNKPFVGPAGKVLTQALQDAEISSDEIRITNLIRCIPRKGRSVRPPTEDEIKVCSEYLLDEIEKFKPHIIVPMGNTAANFLMGVGKISQRRGRFAKIEVRGTEYPAMATWHPAYVVRNRAAMGDLTQDLRKAYRKAIGARDPEEFLKLRTITTLEGFVEWVTETVRKAKAGGVEHLAVDLETSGPSRKIAFDAYHPESYIMGICLARDHKHGVFIALEHRGNEDAGIKPFKMKGYDPLAIKGLLRKLFAACNVVTHNGKFDIRFMTAKYGVWPKVLYFDTKLSCYSLVA